MCLNRIELGLATGPVFEQTANPFKHKAIVTDIDSNNNTVAVDMEIIYTFERK